MQIRRSAAGVALSLAVALIAANALAQPTSTISAKEKMETCKFGAQDQKLTGKAEQDFIKKCMANEPAPKKASTKKTTETK
jgi:hypothetical protein